MGPNIDGHLFFLIEECVIHKVQPFRDGVAIEFHITVFDCSWDIIEAVIRLYCSWDIIEAVIRIAAPSVQNSKATFDIEVGISISLT